MPFVSRRRSKCLTVMVRPMARGHPRADGMLDACALREAGKGRPGQRQVRPPAVAAVQAPTSQTEPSGAARGSSAHSQNAALAG